MPWQLNQIHASHHKTEQKCCRKASCQAFKRKCRKVTLLYKTKNMKTVTRKINNKSKQIWYIHIYIYIYIYIFITYMGVKVLSNLEKKTCHLKFRGSWVVREHIQIKIAFRNLFSDVLHFIQIIIFIKYLFCRTTCQSLLFYL